MAGACPGSVSVRQLLQIERRRKSTIHATGPIQDRRAGGRRRRQGGRAMKTLRMIRQLVLVAAALTTAWPLGADQNRNSIRPTKAELSSSAAQDGSLDNSWTRAVPQNRAGSQVLIDKQLASRVSFLAEGMGFEPTTPCGAPDFESGRWPVRLPSSAPRQRSQHTHLNNLPPDKFVGNQRRAAGCRQSLLDGSLVG